MKDIVQSQTSPQMPLENSANDAPPTVPSRDEEIQKDGDRCTAADGMNLEMIQMMVNQLNTEIATFRSQHDHKESPVTVDVPVHPNLSAHGGDFIPETNSAQGPGVIDQVRATTSSVQAQIERVKRQIELQKELMKQYSEETVSVAKAPETSLDDVKASIDTLKEHMEAISAQPIAEILPQESKELTIPSADSKGSNVTGETNKTDTTCEDRNESKADAKEEHVAKETNSKAKDDLLKKYLLLKVVKDHLGLLTAKMNKLLAAKGIQPAQSTTLQSSDDKKAPVSISVDDSLPTTDPKKEEQAAEVDDGECDEYYMYNDEEKEELYEEDNESEDEIPSEKPQKHAGDIVANTSRTDCISESTEVSCEEMNGETTTSNGKPEDCGGTSDGKDINEERDATNQTEVNNQETDANTDQASNVVNHPSKLFESSALADAEAFLKTYKKKGVVTKDEDEPRDNVADSSKMRTYTLLLKLQKEMAEMQLQMSRLQDHVRSTNAALQTIFDHEFSDM